MDKNYHDSLSQQMQNADFKREWEALEPEFQTINAMIDAYDLSRRNGQSHKRDEWNPLHQVSPSID